MLAKRPIREKVLTSFTRNYIVPVNLVPTSSLPSSSNLVLNLNLAFFKQYAKDDHEKTTPKPGKVMPEPEPTDPAQESQPTTIEPPPTMFSGYGGMTPEDMEKHPTVVMQEHESKLRTWCKGQSMKDLMGHMKMIASHTYYDKFMSQFNNRQFGANGWTDLVEFDLWLKKCEIAEKTGKTKPVMPSPPSKVTTASTEPTKPPKSTSGETSDSLPSLSPAEKERYSAYWEQYKASGDPAQTSPAASPSGSVPSTTTKTPDCKRRLELEAGLREGDCASMIFWGVLHVMLSIHLWRVLYGVFNSVMCFPGDSSEKAPQFCP